MVGLFKKHQRTVLCIKWRNTELDQVHQGPHEPIGMGRASRHIDIWSGN